MCVGVRTVDRGLRSVQEGVREILAGYQGDRRTALVLGRDERTGRPRNDTVVFTDRGAVVVSDSGYVSVCTDFQRDGDRVSFLCNGRMIECP
jgi:hypothetical protein